MIRIGASSDSKASSWMMATLSPIPPVRESSWMISAAVAVPCASKDRWAIERHERSEIEHADLDAVGGEALSDPQRDLRESPPHETIAVIAGTPQRRTAERNRRRSFVSEALLDAPRGRADVLVIQHGVRIGDRTRHQRTGVGRIGGRNDFHPESDRTTALAWL